MGSTRIELDVIVIGGGIAGLWSLDALRRHGYRAILLESDALGGVQTSASQGMIHGGLKYALGGGAGGASAALAAMPAHWAACLRGEALPDLSAAATAARDVLLWSSGSPAARVAALLASHALRGAITELARAERPAPLDHPRFGGRVYRLPDLAVDVASVCAALVRPHAPCVFGIDWRGAELLRDGHGALRGIALPGIELRTASVLLCAGAGNAELLERLGAPSPRMQRRPLHQVLVKHPALPPLFGHCAGLGSRPRLTVSSHRARDGEWVWYLGGELAESGVARGATEQLARAQAELAAVFPWLELRGAAWRTLRVDRAEVRRPGRLRPDDAWVAPVAGAANVLAAWPTKLALAPRLAARVVELLAPLPPAQRALEAAELAALGAACARPPVARPPWEDAFA